MHLILEVDAMTKEIFKTQCHKKFARQAHFKNTLWGVPDSVDRYIQNVG